MAERNPLKAVPPPLKKALEWPKDSEGRTDKLIIRVLSVLLVVAILGAGFSFYKQYSNPPLAIESVAAEVQSLREAVQSSSSQQVIMLKILVLRPSTKVELARKISQSVHRQCEAYKDDPDLVLAIMSRESHFEPKARSFAGALGLMQVRKHWADVHGDEDLLDIETNVRRALYILKIYRHTYKELPVVLAAYNRGQNPVDADLMQGRSTDNQYVRNVLTTYQRLKALN
jgi:soluble lytic murein transglycosylase-like protein